MLDSDFKRIFYKPHHKTMFKLVVEESSCVIKNKKQESMSIHVDAWYAARSKGSMQHRAHWHDPLYMLPKCEVSVMHHTWWYLYIKKRELSVWVNLMWA